MKKLKEKYPNIDRLKISVLFILFHGCYHFNFRFILLNSGVEHKDGNSSLTSSVGPFTWIFYLSRGILSLFTIIQNMNPSRQINNDLLPYLVLFYKFP